MTLKTPQKSEIITQYGRNSTDTGSPEVQVALLSARINQVEILRYEPGAGALDFMRAWFYCLTSQRLRDHG